MDALVKGWFTEFSPDDLKAIQNESSGDKDKDVKSAEEAMGGAWPGQAFSIQVEEVLFRGKSDYQDVMVFKSKTYGNVLVLDGIVQCTERDEFSYQEMLAHLPMFAHPNPKKVLIIGGGDGGILREVLKHDTVESVTMCEIDGMVIEASKKYLPHMSCGFNDPKLTLLVGDGFKFLKENKTLFDVIITDSSDPVGPAESLFGESYYRLLETSLTDDGVLASQAESMWLHLNLIDQLVRFARTLFPAVAYASGNVSTYPSGIIGYLVAGKNKDRDLTVPARVLDKEQLKKMKLKYYNSRVHQAAFVLPQFAAEAIEQL
uniref:PABS domain-containing protein n=1 Tax=Plectus sambesii TaxID=2011161 RepID=A0A914X1F0_9BILA